jgi:hypothetical protein
LPGKVDRHEFEYLLHRKLAFIFNFYVVTGQLAVCTANPTRTEQDFAAKHLGSQSDQTWRLYFHPRTKMKGLDFY